MTQPTPEQHQEFLDYWLEQYNIHDIFIRLSSTPKGYLAWAANRTMLEQCIKKAGVGDKISYSQIPAYSLLQFTPANGDTPLEAAQGAVEAYHIDLGDPKSRVRMNIGCVAIAEHLKQVGTRDTD